MLGTEDDYVRRTILRRETDLHGSWVVTVEQLQPGIVVEYRLRPDQQPTNPDKIWHGRVLHLFVNHSLLYDGVIVEITNPGFEGGTEFVHLSQLTNIIRAYTDVQKP